MKTLAILALLALPALADPPKAILSDEARIRIVEGIQRKAQEQQVELDAARVRISEMETRSVQQLRQIEGVTANLNAVVNLLDKGMDETRSLQESIDRIRTELATAREKAAKYQLEAAQQRALAWKWRLISVWLVLVFGLMIAFKTVLKTYLPFLR